MNWWYSIKFQQFYYYLYNHIHENKLLKKPLPIRIAAFLITGVLITEPPSASYIGSVRV